jgi:protein-tyrosine phosphatase
MPSILFVCTANLYRSPLAAALFARKLHGEGPSHNWNIGSAGTWATAGQRVPPDLMQAAAARGVDLKDHRARRVDAHLLAEFDLVFVMDRGHREALRLEFPFAQQKIHLLSAAADRLEYDVPDPVNSDVDVGEFTAQMSALIERAYPRICQMAEMHQSS